MSAGPAPSALAPSTLAPSGPAFADPSLSAPADGTPATAVGTAVATGSASATSPAVTPAAPRDLPGPLLPGDYEEIDEDRFARSTVAERILFVLAFVLPPIGLIGSLVAAARSSSRRGWVIGLIRAGIAVGIVFSVIAAGFGYAGYKVLQQQQTHARTVAASAQFCAAIAKDPSLVASDGGWPQPAATVPASITAMQAFVARWTALAKVSPAGVRSGASSMAEAGTEVIKSVTTQRTVDDAQNRSLLQSAMASSGVADWHAEYCG